MLRSANLESRQSGTVERKAAATDAPLREFGIKAKRDGRAESGRDGCSAPRIWNQGKAEEADMTPRELMLRSANLESRQSSRSLNIRNDVDAPLREFGIKAKHSFRG